ncbi:hypothetical protein TOPH_08665 [Tolypocladium ophioglossoides CBS 100239]|uniref:NACHT-NTPase and P-loop NTPases N-terminal domain-containing protein n=1 Tax=Tolypocladium ophioglossoides (strain CBS 100239) TaxID=1163406 RepID=A0A0L0MY38_TOLOC|nr:hypothetical protein TOPH_08665 [Tolypocladium ophioglossoides CBS 100239]
MADPLGVVGIVTSITQLVDLSAKIISRVHEYASIANDIPPSFRSLATQLHLLSITLQHVEAQSQAGQLGEVAARAIKDVIDSILHDIVFLEKIFIPVKASTFERSLQALKSLAWEDKVQQRIQRIQANIQLLGFHQNTMQITMGKTVLDMLKTSDSEKVLAESRAQSAFEGDEANVILGQFRDLVSSMNNSAYAARKLESGTHGVVESALSVWLLKITSSWNDYHPTVKFLMTDWDGDAILDLVAVKKQNTGTGRTEVHVLSGASDYQTPLLQVGTPLEETSDNFDFLLADWTGDGRPDLLAIKKNNTGTNSTEIHVLDGGNNFQSFALQVGTALHETHNDATFLTTDWMGTGRADIVFIKRSLTGSNSTEVHILSAAHNFSFFLLQTPTALHETDDTWQFVFTYEFSRTHRPDLAAIKRDGQVIVEVCLLSGVNDFKSVVFRSDRRGHGQGGQRQRVLQLLGAHE